MQGQFGGTRLVKVVVNGDEGRDKLINGINILADAVSSTLGAGGRTVVLEDDFGNPHVSKDGVTVANYINLEDPIENLAVQMVKQAARQTASKAGDGTTTSTVLAQAIIGEYTRLGGDKFSFRDIKKGIDDATKETIDLLVKKSVKVSEKKLESVSIISSNNDEELGKLISSAFKSAGEHGVVTMGNSPTSETFVDVVEGTHIKSNSKSHHFFTSPEKETTVLEKPLIFLCTSEIPNVRRIQGILEHAMKSNRSILLVAPLESQPLAALAMNKVKGNIQVNVIDPPSFGLKRKDILDDLALLSGATVIDESLGDSLDLITPDCLGSATRAVSDKDGTTFIFDSKPEAVVELVEELREQLENEDHLTLTSHIESRLAILTGGVSQIYVGGDSDVEVKEKKDRVDDAIHAVKAAKKEGILPGGGASIHYIARNLDVSHESDGVSLGREILRQALFSPFNKILTNAGLDPMDQKYNIKEWGIGVDVIDGEVKDMKKAGIIDPALVTKESLKNAVSVATTILSTDSVISNVRERGEE